MDKMKEKGSLNGARVVRAAGRKDRHSKVCTARGTRDRRVRLSPKTAILFYDVQERLGCDRPSKAIDWLMNEAKAAIDALDVHAPAAPAADCNRSAPTNAGDPDHQQMVKFECANDDDIPIQGLGFFNGGAAPPCFSPELQASAGGSEAGQFLSAPTSLDLFDANSEIVRMQRILSWNDADAAGVDFNFNYPAAAADYHVFAEREPLQSSYSKMKSNSAQFQGFGFPDQDLLNFKVDEIINPFLSKSSSTASFLPTL